MRLATANGYQTVSERAWPLAGLDLPRSWSNASESVPLASLPGGGYQAATFERIYRSNPWVYAAVQAYAHGVSRLVMKVWQYDADGLRSQVRSDLPGSLGRKSTGQALDYLLRFPEPGVGRQEWLWKIVTDKKVYGNALVTKDRDTTTNVPTALWRVPWKRVSVEEGEQIPILYYGVRSRMGYAEQAKFTPDDVIHFGRGHDVDSPIGLSPMAPLKATLALHDALWRHAVAYFQNSARPSGLVKLDKGANEAIIKTIKEQIEGLYTSPENAGKVLVTSGEWQSMTDSPTHSQIVELARLSREEVAAGYGIPQPMMGILDRAILNNTKELRNLFTREVIGDEASSLIDDVMAQLVYASPVWTGLFTEFDIAEAMRPDPEALAEMALKTRHVLTVNEQREKFFGMNPLLGDDGKPLPEAETTWMPSGMIGLGIEPPAPEAPKQVKGPDGPIADEPVDPAAETPPAKEPDDPAAAAATGDAPGA